MAKDKDLVVQPPPAAASVAPVSAQPSLINIYRARAAVIRDFIQTELSPDDYMVFTDKKTGKQSRMLKKGGTEKMALFLNLRPVFMDNSVIEDPANGIFMYRLTCQLVSRDTGEVMAEGAGSCNSHETHYKNKEIADLPNTILKMAQIRAFRAAIKQVAAMSGSFVIYDPNEPPEAEAPSTIEMPAAADDGAGQSTELSDDLLDKATFKDFCEAWKKRGYLPHQLLAALQLKSFTEWTEGRAKLDKRLGELLDRKEQ